MSVRLALFDCDGTLSDGQAAVCAAMDTAFAEAGLPAPERNAVRRSVGLSLPQAIARLAPDAARETQVMAVDACTSRSMRASQSCSAGSSSAAGCWAWRPASPIGG